MGLEIVGILQYNGFSLCSARLGLTPSGQQEKVIFLRRIFNNGKS